ncbi:MAG: hypothetical protein HOC74_07325 [Gemmatimonadetes bacterium]|jgi:uncharacterized protein|nr:hypothetical protein [Gemmatimonadota bacterium]
MQIRIKWSSGELLARLDDTPTAQAVIAALPCQSSANTWGDEVYFDMPVNVELEPDARQVVDPGTVCFWVQGSSLALPFGPTPVSQGDECRLVSEVNVLGMIEGDPKELGKVRGGETVRVELVEE